MKVVTMGNFESASDWTAKYIRKRITEFDPSGDRYFTLGLSSDTTQLGLYRNLVELCEQGLLSFKYVKTFNTGEYIGLDKDNMESARNFMWHNFFQLVDIASENVHMLDGNAENLDQECEAYEAKIRDAGGIELFVAGVDRHGNAGGNQTGSSLGSRTRVKASSAQIIKCNTKYFGGDVRNVPTRVVTVGIATIMEARQVLVLITGEDQSNLLKRAIEGGISSTTPISAFQQHEQAIVVCDEDATMELKVRTVKHHKGLAMLTRLTEFDHDC